MVLLDPAPLPALQDMKAEPALVEAIAAIKSALAPLGSPYMIIGGVAVIARGLPRLTDDVDATLWAPGLDVRRVLDVLNGQGIVGRYPDAEQFARQRQVLLLRHEPSRTPLEISLAWLPFEKERWSEPSRWICRGIACRWRLPRI